MDKNGFYRAKVTEVDYNNNDYGEVRLFIPDLMTSEDSDYDEEGEMGLIAMPANNPIGGRNSDNSGSYGHGMVIVPNVGDWVWCFFEGGDTKKPFYWNAINIMNSKLPPQNRNVAEPNKVYTLMHTKDGRTIVLADSEDVQRVEITGKKRWNLLSGAQDRLDVSPDDLSPDGDDQDPYRIDTEPGEDEEPNDQDGEDGNQSTILLDEREGQEKILLKTWKGDYIHMDVDERELHMYFKNGINIKTDKSFELWVGTNMITNVVGIQSTVVGLGVNFTAGLSINHMTAMNYNIKAAGEIKTDGSKRYDQSGKSKPAIPLPIFDPKGGRDT